MHEGASTGVDDPDLNGHVHVAGSLLNFSGEPQSAQQMFVKRSGIEGTVGCQLNDVDVAQGEQFVVGLW